MDEELKFTSLERCALLRALAMAESEGGWEFLPAEEDLIPELVRRLGGTQENGFIELPDDCGSL